MLGLCPQAGEEEVVEYLEAVRRGVQLCVLRPCGRATPNSGIHLLRHYRSTMRRLFRQANTGRRVNEWVNEWVNDWVNEWVNERANPCLDQ